MKSLLKSLLYIPKHTKSIDRNAVKLLMPSILGIAACVVCLIGMTWAWFSADVRTEPQTLRAANFDVAVAVKEGETPVEPSADGSYRLEGTKSYTITLMADGSAQKGGYCIVKNAAESKTHAAWLHPETAQSVTFTLTPASTGDSYTFTASWGSYTGTVDITDDGEIDDSRSSASAGLLSADGTVYVVQEGDNLVGIAKQFDTTAEKLAAYNKLTNPNDLKIGDEIRIPPADYAIPEEPTASAPATTKAPAQAAPSTTPANATTTQPTQPVTTTAPETTQAGQSETTQTTTTQAETTTSAITQDSTAADTTAADTAASTASADTSADTTASATSTSATAATEPTTPATAG